MVNLASEDESQRIFKGIYFEIKSVLETNSQSQTIEFESIRSVACKEENLLKVPSFLLTIHKFITKIDVL